MIYRLPEINDKNILQEYMQEHYNNDELEIHANLDFSSCEYTSWLEMIHKNALTGNDEWGKSLLYLCFDDNKLVGLLSIRYDLPQTLSKIYGDIGYGVRPTERNKGYATAMLKYALDICKEKGLDKVLLGCYKDNLASVATIKKNGGVLVDENNLYEPGRISQYYLITL